MPDRIIRSDLLDSPRYLGLASDSARLLFVHLLLLADPFGNVEVGTVFLRRKAFAEQRDDAVIAKMLSDLFEAGLIVPYQDEESRKCYAHIPRYRQRLRYVKTAHPTPPNGVMLKDDIRRINELTSESPGDHQAITRASPLEVKRSEVKRSEVEVKQRERQKRAATLLPSDWQLPQDWKDWACSAFNLDPQRVVRISLAFRDHWISTTKNPTKRDWAAVWRRWVGVAVERGEQINA